MREFTVEFEIEANGDKNDVEKVVVGNTSTEVAGYAYNLYSQREAEIVGDILIYPPGKEEADIFHF